MRKLLACALLVALPGLPGSQRTGLQMPEPKCLFRDMKEYMQATHGDFPKMTDKAAQCEMGPDGYCMANHAGVYDWEP